MCGRYVSTHKPEDLVELFGVTRWSPDDVVEPDWNVAPTKPVWTVLERVDRDTGEVARSLRAMRWGLVPSWGKGPEIGAKLINARAETVHEKPAFRKAFASRRCLLPADGFYEWKELPVAPGSKGRKRKQPFFLRPSDGSVLPMAGLYEFWRDPSKPEGAAEAWLTTASIITTDATDAAGEIHPRMPLTIAAASHEDWLDPEHDDVDHLRSLLVTPAEGRLEAYPVSTAVNFVGNNGPQLVAPVPEESAPTA